MIKCLSRAIVVIAITTINSRSVGAVSDGHYYEDAVRSFEQQQYDQALVSFAKLAESGDDRAQYRLGFMYNYGLGVEVDNRKAAYWYERSASANNLQAQHDLGVLHLVGLDGTPDYEAAIRWLSASANQGFEPSFRELGWAFLRRGKDLADLCSAIYWYDKTDDKSLTPEPIISLKEQLQSQCDDH